MAGLRHDRVRKFPFGVQILFEDPIYPLEHSPSSFSSREAVLSRVKR